MKKVSAGEGGGGGQQVQRQDQKQILNQQLLIMFTPVINLAKGFVYGDLHIPRKIEK